MGTVIQITPISVIALTEPAICFGNLAKTLKVSDIFPLNSWLKNSASLTFDVKISLGRIQGTTFNMTLEPLKDTHYWQFHIAS